VQLRASLVRDHSALTLPRSPALLLPVSLPLRLPPSASGAGLVLGTGAFVVGHDHDFGHEQRDGSAPGMNFSREKLSRRETEVLRELLTGKTNEAIGRALFVTPDTVKAHLSRVYWKLGVSCRAEAVAVALRLGLAQ
jgi:DNA-binding CsgD family transcriptional regulator